MLNFSESAQLIENIKRGFSDTAEKRIEKVVPEILLKDTEAMSMQLAFGGKTWPEVSLELLERNEGYRGFLSEEALTHFLPGFMIESLTIGGIYAVAPPLMRTFSPRPDGQILDETDLGLDRNKCCVMYQYVDFLCREFPDVFDDAAHAESAAEYWEKQCRS